MNKCIAFNTLNSPCKFLTFDKNTDYCGHHKNKEFYEAMVFQRKNKAKIYYKENKEMLSNKHKIYYEKNKIRLLEKYICDCGSTVSKICLTRHNKTHKHNDYLEIMKHSG